VRGGIAIAVTALVLATAAAAQDACLSGDSTLGDQRAIATLRESTDATCGCAPAVGASGRRAFRRCAREAISDAIVTSALRRECLSTARKLYKDATCGTDRVACGDNFVGGESLTAFSGLEGQQYLIEVMSKVGGGGAATKLNIGYAPESLLFPIKPLKMKIKAGESAATKSIKVKVKNPGNEAHVIEMNAFEIVVLGPSCNLAFGTPDFDKDMPGSQDTVMLDAGKKASATVQVSVNAADVNSIGGKPVRCMAYVILGGATPFPEVNYQNDNYVFPVDILDMNDD